MDRNDLERLVRGVLEDMAREGGACPVKKAALPAVRVTEADRLDTGAPADRVYTHNVFSLTESPRLGAGIMEMTDTTFPWHLAYDEMDYVIEGRLDICCGDRRVSAGAGELIYIPRGSDIRFSVEGHARFLYVTYPADWQGTKE